MNVTVIMVDVARIVTTLMAVLVVIVIVDLH